MDTERLAKETRRLQRGGDQAAAGVQLCTAAPTNTVIGASKGAATGRRQDHRSQQTTGKPEPSLGHSGEFPMQPALCDPWGQSCGVNPTAPSPTSCPLSPARAPRGPNPTKEKSSLWMPLVKRGAQARRGGQGKQETASVTTSALTRNDNAAAPSAGKSFCHTSWNLRAGGAHSSAVSTRPRHCGRNAEQWTKVSKGAGRRGQWPSTCHAHVRP